MPRSTVSTVKSRDKKLRLLWLLQVKLFRIQQDPLRYAKSHPKQQEFFASDKSLRLLLWGNRTGKTEGSAQEVARYALAAHPTREVLPGSEIWCASPSYDSQESTTQKALLRYIPRHMISKVHYVHRGTISSIHLTNKTVIRFKSYEQGREKFQGAGVRLIWFDEEVPQDIFDECFVRMAAGQPLDIIMSMTPIKGLTWIFDRLYSSPTEDTFISTAGWDDNPYLTAAQKDRMARGLTKEALEVRKYGRFVKRVGLVCSWWDRSAHIRHYDSYPLDWQYYEVLDYGYSDPAAYLLIAVDSDNSIHVVGGFRMAGLLPDAVAEKRNAITGSSITIIQGFMDSDNSGVRAELASRHGIPLTPVLKSTASAGSMSGTAWDEHLANRLASFGAIQPGTGQPRLFISDNLIAYDDNGTPYNWLAQEIENLVWKEKKTVQGHEDIPRWDDHRRFRHHFDGIRALAYFCSMYIQDTAQVGAFNYLGQAATNRFADNIVAY